MMQHLPVIVCVSDVHGFPSEEKLIQYYMSFNNTYEYTCAIIFEDIPESLKFQGHMKYKIRISEPNVRTSILFDEFQTAGPGISGTSIIEMCSTLQTSLRVFYVSGI
jgi:hypothetical protein